MLRILVVIFFGKSWCIFVANTAGCIFVGLQILKKHFCWTANTEKAFLLQILRMHFCWTAGAFLLLEANATKDAKASLCQITSFWIPARPSLSQTLPQKPVLQMLSQKSCFRCFPQICCFKITNIQCHICTVTLQRLNAIPEAFLQTFLSIRTKASFTFVLLIKILFLNLYDYFFIKC